MTDKLTYEQLELKVRELEKKAEFFQIISENSYDWELFRDPNGKILFCSNSFERITGYSVGDFINGQITEKDFVHPDDWNFVLSQMQNTINQVKSETDIEFRLITKSNEIKTINLSSQPVFL